MEPIEYLWKDRKRHLGLPLSFTRYRLSGDRLFCETGFFNIKSDEVLLYRVRDLQLNMTLGQRIFGVGTVCVVSSDKSVPHLDLKNVKRPREVKELIHQNVEAAKDKRRMRTTELVGGEGPEDGMHEVVRLREEAGGPAGGPEPGGERRGHHDHLPDQVFPGHGGRAEAAGPERRFL